MSSATLTGTTNVNAFGTAQTSAELIATTSYSNWDSSVWDYSGDYPTLGTSPASIFYFKSNKINGSFSTSTDWVKSTTIDGAYESSALKPDYTNSFSIEVISGNTITLNTGKSAYVSATTVNGKLIIDTGATLNIENKTGEDLIVNGELELKGTLNIGASATVAIDELISPTSKYLSWTGNDHNVISSAIATSNTTANLYPNYIKRSWNLASAINDATEPNRSKNITFYWSTADDNNYNWGAAIPILYDGTTETTGTTVSIDGDIRSATFTYTFPEYNSLTEELSNIEFKIGLGDNQTLPVQLSTFDAFNQQEGTVMIQWITQSESNLDGYRLFRNNNNSLDTSVMLDVFISGTNTSQSQTYSHIDETITENGIYYYWIQMIDYDGTNSFYGPAILQVDDDFNNSVDVAYKTGFVSIYPNPFNPTTTISYYLELNSPVLVDIYNIKGQLVKTFDVGMQTIGFHKVVWNGESNTGNSLPSGIYFSRMKTQAKTDIKKIILLK